MDKQKRPPGFAILDEDVMDVFWLHLKPHHRSLIPLIVRHGHEAFPKQSDVATKIGVQRDAVGVTLAQLVHVGMFTVQKRYRPDKGGRTSNVYSPTDWSNPQVQARIIHNLKTMKFNKRGHPMAADDIPGGPGICSSGECDSMCPVGSTCPVGTYCHTPYAGSTRQRAAGSRPGSRIDTQEDTVAAPEEIAAQFPARGCARVSTPLPTSLEAGEGWEALPDDGLPDDEPLEAGEWEELDHHPEPVLPAPFSERPARPEPAPRANKAPEDWDGRDLGRHYWRLVGEHRAANGLPHGDNIPKIVFKTVGQLQCMYSPELLFRVITATVNDFDAIKGSMGRAGEDVGLDERALSRIHREAFALVAEEMRRQALRGAA